MKAYVLVGTILCAALLGACSQTSFKGSDSKSSTASGANGSGTPGQNGSNSGPNGTSSTQDKDPNNNQNGNNANSTSANNPSDSVPTSCIAALKDGVVDPKTNFKFKL